MTNSRDDDAISGDDVIGGLVDERQGQVNVTRESRQRDPGSGERDSRVS